MEKLLKEIEEDVIRIKTRLKYLTAIENEIRDLSRSTNNKIHVRNDIVYQMVMDSYDMIVIDLASLCRGMLSIGGFFNRLNNHLRKLRRTKLKSIQVPKANIVSDRPLSKSDYDRFQREHVEYVQKEVKGALDEAFDRLFPPRLQKRNFLSTIIFGYSRKVAPLETVTQADIRHLKDRFEKLITGLIRDRDAKRAHKYEKRKSDNTVAMLSLGQLEDEFKKIEQIINDLRAITIGGTFLYDPPTLTSVNTAAQDVADLILIGSTYHMAHFFGVNQALGNKHADKRYFWQFRECFYANASMKRLLEALKAFEQRKFSEPRQL